MKREDRYLVLKYKDINNYLDYDDHLQLYLLCRKINNERLRNNRQILECVVVEND